ncbi:MAG: hypothetical protein MK116_08760, partial [Phycisphaerales bacterium]|nr:hypothetical protein [Phycisphaerales bacterium]
MRCAVLAATCCLLPAAASADLLVVPDDHATIQAAIDASQDGDEIFIREGTYVEWAINPGGRKISITGETGDDGERLVTIDGNQKDSVIICESNESDSTKFANLIITNGSGTEYNGFLAGGGLFNTNDSAAVFENCLFTGNQAQYGGGILSVHGALQLVDCEIRQNTATQEGGGIYNSVGNLTLSRCWICENTPNQISGNYQEFDTNCITEYCKDADSDGIADCLDPCPTWPDCSDDGTTLYVSVDQSIQSAIDAAPAGGVVLLEEGVYEEGDLTTRGKAVTVEGVEPQLMVDYDYGWNHDWQYYDGTVIYPPAGQAVFTIDSGEGPDTVLRNLIFGRDGSRVVACSPTFETVVFTAQGIGGDYDTAMSCTGPGSPTFRDCIFYPNLGNIWEAAMRNSNGSSTVLENCNFWTVLDSVFYVGMRNENCTMTVTDTTIRGCGDGVENIGCDSTFRNCDIRNNEVSGLYNYHGTPTFIDCRIRWNHDRDFLWGRGVRNSSSDARFVNCEITGNSGQYDGVGVSNGSCSPIFLGCTISGNGTWEYWEHEDEYSGGMINYTATPYIIACTISGNACFYCPSASIASHGDSLPVISLSKICSNDLNPISGPYQSVGNNCIVESCEDLEDDADGDGVFDCMDQCPGVADVDTDEDGIADCNDQCPGEPDFDSDHDGVADCVDLCPGFDDSQDSDGDGIPDGCDSCAGDLDGNGTVGIADLLLVIDLWG